MDGHTLQRLKDGVPTASWALWSPEFPEAGCVEEEPDELVTYIHGRREELRPSVVLLSLNPSTHMPSNYANFHSTEPKHRNAQFRELIEESGLDGAFMTDLVERVGADSREIEPTADDVENLLEQLELLGQDRYYLICFLEPVYETLKTYFDGETRELQHEIRSFSTNWKDVRLHCYRVWFHANWGANQDKVAELRKQLSYLSSEIIAKPTSDLSHWTDREQR